MSKAADLAKFIGNNEQNMKLLLNATISSAVAQYDIDSTYINMKNRNMSGRKITDPLQNSAGNLKKASKSS